MREPPLRPLSQVNKQVWCIFSFAVGLFWTTHRNYQNEAPFCLHAVLFFLMFFFIIVMAGLMCTEEVGKVAVCAFYRVNTWLTGCWLCLLKPLSSRGHIERLSETRGQLGCFFFWRATVLQKGMAGIQKKAKGPRVIWLGLCNRCCLKSHSSSVTSIFPLSCSLCISFSSLSLCFSFAFFIFRSLFLWIKESHLEKDKY